MLQKNTRVGQAEAIDALLDIANSEKVFSFTRNCVKNAVLHLVGVLILVHQNIAKLRLIAGKHIRMVAEKQESIEQQIIEVYSIRQLATFSIAAVNIAQGGHLGGAIAFVGCFVVGLARR